MCGIVGYISLSDEVLEIPKNRIFDELLFMDTLRGEDSTGIMTLEKDFDWEWQKAAVPAPEFMQDKEYVQRNTKVWACVGHNRAATIGKVTTDNAHPFEHENVLLVHNGTVRSTHLLPAANSECAVDSSLIAYNLSEAAVDNADSVLSRINGAYALVWFDRRDNSVNFARNHERPLHMGLNSTGNVLLFASDGNMLYTAGARMNNSGVRPASIYQLGAGKHLKYKKGSLIPAVSAITPFTYPMYNVNRGAYPAYNANNKWEWDDDMETGYYNSRRVGVHNPRVGDYSIRSGYNQALEGKTVINNKVQPIPEVFLEMLQWFSLDHTKGYLFKPERFQAWGDNVTGQTYGKVWHPDWQRWMPAYVTDGTSFGMASYGHQWTAVPIGINYINMEDDSADELTVIMKLKYYNYVGDGGTQDAKLPVPTTTTIPSPTSKPNSQQIYTADTEEEDDEAWTSLYNGPRGYVSEEAFKELTSKGCCMCSRDIELEEHEDIAWVGEMKNQPLCMECAYSGLIGNNHDYYSH